ncbi:MAG: indolepyruvate ferredoxin oxidoreductase family protein [Gemmatimonadota bacterium]
MPETLSLDSKYTEDGPVILTGVQALVRVLLDQQRADVRRGLRTGTLVSGYRGSPLGGFDFILQQQRALLEQHHIRFIPGVNEELGATAIFGAQIANLFPDPKYDGVLGMWYGKGPGVDRCGDVFKHGNLAGVGRNGGVLAVGGDDPASKSSTVPSHSEVAFFDAQMPVLYPGSVQEVLELGLFGYALSRYSGLWVGFKMTTNVADAYETAWPSSALSEFTTPDFDFRGKPWQHTQSVNLFAPFNLQMEQELFEGRLEAARRFARANRVNKIAGATGTAWLGIAVAGKTYYDVREALTRLGLDDEELIRYGIRILHVGLLYPLEPMVAREFAHGLEQIVVIEEKRSFVELFLREALYEESKRPRIVGKWDEHGAVLVPAHGELDADMIAGILARRLAERLPQDVLAPRVARLAPTMPAEIQPLGFTAQRHAYFCSGCPHTRSTIVPEGSLAGGGIGCHGMAVMMERQTVGFTQMGGEGCQWVGASLFSNMPHLFQNMGDGTYFHSGSLAVRQAVAAGTTITFKILYNAAVAMTGGQHADGAIPIPDLARELQAEGVRTVLVLADDLAKYEDAPLPNGVELWHRDRLDEAQRLLREMPGVTALIYDQHCAADLRRKRKRGEAPERAMRVLINEAVCEGCGDCGVKSNCLSVQPVETEFGRKTMIHQSSCNKDYSCLDGDCPSFVTVVPNGEQAKPSRPRPAPVPNDSPEPVRIVGASANLYLMGIGGTGVVTANQILGAAALLEGKGVKSLDQTGLSQKGGAVVSHLKILAGSTVESNKVGVGQADAYLGFDVLTAADQRHLSRARPDRTVAIVSSSHVPTGLMVRNAGVTFPNDSLLHRRIDTVTRPGTSVYLDAERLSETMFGSHLPANLIVIGAAYQRGVIPLAAASIEQAITLNGGGAAVNVQAFRLGRKLVADPAWEPKAADDSAAPATEDHSFSPMALDLIQLTGLDGEVRRLLDHRVPELMAYQNAAYAKQYVDFVVNTRLRERAVGPDTRLSEAVARYLFKLMAYKDEYEVARLYLAPGFAQAVERQFGAGANVTYRLHPPVLRALGMKRKLALGSWFRPVFRMLYALRSLRGTAFDPFGRDQVRREERRLIEEYRTMIEREIKSLSAGTYERAVALAAMPDVIRGYDSIKLGNIAKYRAKVAELLEPAAEPERVAV